MSGTKYEETRWECDTCEKTGTITYEKHADVFTVLQLLATSHRAASPACTHLGVTRVTIKEHRS